MHVRSSYHFRDTLTPPELPMELNIEEECDEEKVNDISHSRWLLGTDAGGVDKVEQDICGL